MASVGTAYVSIRVDTKGFEKSLDSMLSRLSAKMETQGTKLGNDFTKGLKKADWNSGFSGLTDAAGKASTKAVRSLDQVENKIISLAHYSSDAGSSMADDFDKVGDAARDAKGDVGDLSKELTGAKRAAGGINLGGVGGGGGGALRSAGDSAGFFSSKLQELASHGDRSSAILSGLYTKAAFLGTGLAALAGGASAAVQGLGAIAANAVAMVPALSVATTGLIGLAQVAATIGMSFAGVGNAIGAGMKAVTAVNPATTAAATGTKKLGVEMQKMVKPAKVSRDAIISAKEAAKEAARGIVEAKNDLKDAYRDVGWAAKDAAERTADAEADLADAQGETLEAQEALNEARAEAIEQLEDIAFKAEDAALGEERAGLKLEDAYAKLLEVSQLAPDDKARREAELAYKEAELGLRQARDAREDADAEAAQAAETGIEGTEAMVSAREDLASAQDNEAQATRDLADAREEERRTTIENAQQIVDAENAVIDARNRHRQALGDVAEAQADYAAAVKAANAAAAEANANAREANARAREAAAAAAAQVPALTAVQKAYDAYEQALKDMSPSQEKFVRMIVGMRDEFIKARQEIAEPLFASLLRAFDTLQKSGLFTIVKDGLIGTSEALGKVVEKAANVASQPAFKKSFGDVMASNNKSIELFGKAGVFLADAFVQVADAASPLLEDLAQWAKNVAKGWSETTRAKNATGELTATFETAADRVREFWGLAKELWRTLEILGGAANQAANNFGDFGRKGEEQEKKFGFITSMTNSLDTFNTKLEESPGLVGGFSQALDNLVAVGGAVKTTVIDPLISLGQNKKVEEAFAMLGDKQTGDTMQRIADASGDAMPKLAKIADDVLEIIAALSESKSIEHFLDIIGLIVEKVKDLANWMAKTKWKGLNDAITAVGDFGAKVADMFGFDQLSEFFDDIDAGGKSILGLTGFITGAWAAWKLFKKGFVLTTSPFANMLTKAGIGGGSAGKVAGAGGEATDKSWEGQVLKGLTSIKLAIDACCGKLSAAMGRGAAAGAAGGVGGGGMMAAGAAGAAAGVGDDVAKISKFSKFTKFLGPLTKLAPVASLAVRGLGFAFRFMMGPFGLILMLLPLLWPLLVKLEEKTGIFSKTLDVLTAALGWVWEKIKQLWDWLTANAGKVWDEISASLTQAKEDFENLKAKLQEFWDKVQEVWNNVTGFIGDKVETVKTKITGMWDNLKTSLGNAWDWVVEKWNGIVEWVKGRPAQFMENLKTIWDAVKDKLGDAWDWVTTKWGNIVTWVKGRPAQFMENMSTLWNVITEKLGDAWTWVTGKWSDIKDSVGGWAGQLTTKLGDLWGAFKDKLIEAWAWVVGKWDDIKTAIGKWPGDISDKLKNIWNGLGSGLISALNWVGGKVNWMIDKLNGILDKFGGGKIEVSWPQLEWVGFAGGGPVRGPGGPKGDKIPARLSDGEHVLTASEVRAMGGHRNVKALRQAALRGDLPSGGLFGSIIDKFKDVTSALGNGVEYAVKWVVGNVVNQLPDNMVGNMARGFIEKAADAIVSWGKKKDEEAAAAAQAGGTSAGAYHGPPGGWTYPLTRRYSAYNFAGHSPSWAVDIGAPGGTPVRAASAGKIVKVADLGTTSYGKYMVLSHAGGVTTLYAHLSSFGKGPGAIVKTGEIIGVSGNTGGVRGASGGYHLHFELMPSSSTIAAMAARGVQLGRGGIVAPSRGGTLATLAEAGRSERVTPLDREGFTPSERKMIQLLETRLGAGGGGDTYQIHPSAKVDEVGLADLVARRVSWNRRRGAGTR